MVNGVKGGSRGARRTRQKNCKRGIMIHKVYGHVLFCKDGCSCPRGSLDGMKQEDVSSARVFETFLRSQQMIPMGHEVYIEYDMREWSNGNRPNMMESRRYHRIDVLVMGKGEMHIVDIKSGTLGRYNFRHAQNVRQVKRYMKLWNSGPNAEHMGSIKTAYLYYQDVQPRDRFVKVCHGPDSPKNKKK